MAVAVPAPARPAPQVRIDRPELPSGQYVFERSPVDLLRLLTGLLLLVGTAVLAVLLPDALLGLEVDLVELVRGLPDGVVVIALGTVRVLSLLVGVVLVGWLAWRRQWPLLGRLGLAAVLAAVSWRLASRLLEAAPEPAIALPPPPAWATSQLAAVNAANLAVAVATYLVVRPLVTVPYRRVVLTTITLMALHGMVSAVDLPRSALLAVGCGFVAGSAVLLALGRPVRPLGGGAVTAALRRVGVADAVVHTASVDARASRSFRVRTADGRGLFVEVVGREQRSSDLLVRTYRWLRFRGLGDELAPASLKQAVEHEVAVVSMAVGAGVRTPRLLAVTEVDADRLALVFSLVPGRSLRTAPAELLTDELLQQLWLLVADLHRAGIAHRDLRLANVLLDDTGTPWLVGFGSGAVAAREEQLAGDVAELLSATAAAVGPVPAVTAAAGALPAAQLRAALPRLQPNALSADTRRAVRASPGLSRQLQAAAAAAVGADSVELQRLERLRLRTLLVLVGTGLAAYVLISQVTQIDDLPGIVAALDWRWAVVALVASAATYAAAALNLMGGFPQRLPLGTTTAVQVATSFVNRITPAQLGGMALNVRFLQRQGVDAASAVAGVGLTQLVGLLLHLALGAAFVAWAGSTAEVETLPSSSTVLLVVAVLVGLAGVALAVRPLRALLRTQVVPSLRRAGHSLHGALADPGRVALAFTGALLLNLFYVAALYASVRAFDVEIGLAAAGAVYMAAAAVASAAPTPGGVGPVEAALIAGLTAVGLTTQEAVPSVLVFRIATFWLPVLPGWFAFTRLTAREVL